MLIPELLMGSILLLIANNLVSVEQDQNLINTSVDLALKSIKDAQLRGADVSDLVSNFNVALDLLQQAEKLKFDSCSSREDCNEQAAKIFVKITNDAHLLKEKAEAMSALQKLANFTVYTPVTAFAASLVGYCFLRVWRSNESKRFMEMEIREK